MTPDLIAGRYRVVRAVGRGGMGTVWLCHDEVLGREVAVKQIGMLPGETAPDAARALREARTSAALNHRNVVSIFDVVDDDTGHAWLVMEYVASKTLGELVREEGPLPPRRVAWIGAQVADGLAAAHALGTIHRDVKPGNILVGEGDVAKITDFGIARRQGDEQLTRTGLVTGTPSYFSPELARGEDPGPESDVYALGATLYLAVEGRAPYPEQRNPILLLQKIAAEKPPPANRAGPLTGPITRMMDRDPRSRWAMADAAAALRRVAEHGDAGGATAALTPATAVAPEPDDAGQEPRRRRWAPWLVGAAALLVVVLGVGYMAMTDDAGDPAPRAGAPAASPSAATEPSAKSPTAAPTHTPEPTPTPTRTPTTSPGSTESTESTESSDDAGEEPVDAVTEYFSVMPGDPDAGWQRLAPSMQAQGRESYEQWWSAVEAVDLHSAAPVGSDQVRIDLTYRFTDGTASRETQLLRLEESARGWLIADDQVLSSRAA